MAEDAPGSDQPPDEPAPDAVDRAAAIDDFFGGFAPHLPDDAVALPGDASPLPGSLDLLLLLRQAGASGIVPLPATPDTIGRYRVVRLAGRGGFSCVWEAFDPVLRRRVAVKVCTPDALISPAVRSRFRREAELASRLMHPHIVTIHEVGEDGGLEFITSEFCASGSLADWLTRHPGPVPPRTAARIAKAVADAANHAHDAGIIHRDIKPGNVMLAPVDGRDDAAGAIPPERGADAAAITPALTVKLGDFGLGRQNDPGADEDPLTQLTTEGSRLGTPAWMAPEQIDRSFGAVGPATDVHAIGLLLDRMLTGRPLRGGKTDVETFREVLLDDPAPANQVALGVPADLSAVCLKCLMKQPGERYPSAADLADDLGRWLAGLPTWARPLTPLERLGRTMARRPVVTGLVAAAVLATCLAGWAAFERAREVRKTAAHQGEIRLQNAAAELRRGFESLRAGNVAGTLNHLAHTASIDPVLANSLAARWLDRRLHGEREIVLAGKPAGAATPADLYSLAVSPDGRAAVVGGADGSLRLLQDIEGRPRIQVIPSHDEINDVCFSPDGRLFASAGQDGRVRWWSVDSATSPVGETPPAGCPLFGICFAADSASVFYGGEDRILRRIDLAAARAPLEIHRLEAPEGETPEIEAICRAGDTVVVACGAMLTAFDAAKSDVLWSRHHAGSSLKKTVLHALAASPSGDRIAAGGTDRDLTIWDIASGQPLAVFPAHPNWIQACRFSADGRLLATACRDGAVRVFDASTGATLAKLLGHAGRVWDVDFQPDGGLLTAGADGTVRRWDPVDSSPSSVFRHIPVPGHAIMMLREAGPAARSSGDDRLVAIREMGMPLLVDLGNGEAKVIAAADHSFIHCAAVDEARGRMAFGFASEARASAPLVIPLEGGHPVQYATVPEGDRMGSHVTWAPDGTLVTNSSEGRVLAWSPSLDRVMTIADVDVPLTKIEAAPLAPPRVAVAGKPGVIVRLDRADRVGGSKVRLDDMGDTIAAMAWSPDGSWLACGLRNGSLHVFDGMTGKRLGSLAPHERQIVDLAWSPDGRVLVTADADCLRISDVATLSTYDELRPGWQIETMCLAADAGWIAIAGRAAVQNPAKQARLAILDLEPR